MFDIALSGINASNKIMKNAAENISNWKSVGFKEKMSRLVAMANGGVSFRENSNISTQGAIVTTNIGSNVAINGKGFFVTSSSTSKGSTSFTRAGDFIQTGDGYFLNSQNQYLMGHKISTIGATGAASTISDLDVVKIDNKSVKATASTKLDVFGNLNAQQIAYSGAAYVPLTNNMSSGTVKSHVKFVQTILDSQGVGHNITCNFLKTASNTWQYELSTSDGVIGGRTDGLIGYGAINFGTKGEYSSSTVNSIATSSGTKISIPWASGVDASNIDLQFSDMTQFSGSNDALGKVDGSKSGSFAGFEIQENGDVNATYSNGQKVAQYKLYLATFSNQDGLSSAGAGVYSSTSDSGQAVISLPGDKSAGRVISKKYEGSNVNSTEQLLKLIEGHQHFSACAKGISTERDNQRVLDKAIG